MGGCRNWLTNHDVAYLSELGDELGRVFKDANEPIIEAINNLAKNTGNKTTREYNELKTKYEELEKKYSKADSLLKSIITINTMAIFNHGYRGDILTSDNVVEIMDESYKDFQEEQTKPFPNPIAKRVFDVSNEVYEKLMRR